IVVCACQRRGLGERCSPGPSEEVNDVHQTSLDAPRPAPGRVRPRRSLMPYAASVATSHGHHGENLYCSFCGKGQREVRKLIAGPPALAICDSCVARITAYMDPKPAGWKKSRPSATAALCSFCNRHEGQVWTIFEENAVR